MPAPVAINVPGLPASFQYFQSFFAPPYSPETAPHPCVLQLGAGEKDMGQPFPEDETAAQPWAGRAFTPGCYQPVYSSTSYTPTPLFPGAYLQPAPPHEGHLLGPTPPIQSDQNHKRS